LIKILNKISYKISDKRILVTGGLGFIGSNLCYALIEYGAQVTIFDNMDPESGANMYNIQGFKNEVKLIKADLNDYNSIVEAIKNIDIIFNCAASTSHINSMKYPLFDLDVNSKGVLNLLEAIKKTNKYVKLVHLGTTTQMGKLLKIPADENHSEFPLDIYSANKVASEKYVLIYSRTYNIDATVIRLGNVYGPRAIIKSGNYTFNNYFIGLCIQNLPITIYKPGTQIRNIMYIEDAVNSLLLAGFSKNSGGQAFIATSDDHFSIIDIAQKICDVFGGSIDLINWPNDMKNIEIGDAKYDNTKIKNILKWEQTVDIDEGLRLTKDYFSKNSKYYF